MTFKELFDNALQIAQAEAPKSDMNRVRNVFENALITVLDNNNILHNIPWDAFYIRNSYGKDKYSQFKVEKEAVANVTNFYSFPVLTYKVQSRRVSCQNSFGRDYYEYVAKGYSEVLFNGYSEEDSHKLMQADVEAFLTAMYEKDETIKKNNELINEHEKQANSIIAQYGDMIQDFFNGLAMFKDLPNDIRAVINETLIKTTGYRVIKN